MRPRQPQGRYLNSNNTRLFRPIVPQKHNGGVGIFTLHPITKIDDWQWDNDTQGWHKTQLTQLAEHIRELSHTSGNPVIVMGDFNIGGPKPAIGPPGNAGYGDIVAILRAPRDLWLDANLLADSSLGYTNGCGLFASDPNGCFGKKRIDYIFHVTDPELTNSPFQIVIGEEGVSRVRWAEPVQVSPVPIHYVADHFGVDATIEVRHRPRPKAKP